MHPGILGVHFGSNVFLLIVLVNINAMYCHVLFLHHFQINFNTSGFGKTFDNFILAFGSIYIYIYVCSSIICRLFYQMLFIYWSYVLTLGIQHQVVVTSTVSWAISSKEPTPKDGTEADTLGRRFSKGREIGRTLVGVQHGMWFVKNTWIKTYCFSLVFSIFHISPRSIAVGVG